MASHWNDEILDRFAESVFYGIRMCLSQLGMLVEKYNNEIPAGYAGPHEDALLEAGLMHLRALDDFFKGGQGGGQGRPPDMRASNWVNWEAIMWLDPRVHSRIDWQVVHMSSLASMEFPRWNLAEYCAALCDEIERFFKAVEAQCPDRLPAFGGAREFARNAAPNFAKYV